MLIHDNDIGHILINLCL